MKVTYNWLREFVDIKILPEVLAEKLTMAGLEVVSLERFSDDWVFEIEVTTNRPDWLSVIGIAREVAAITGKKFKLPQEIAVKVKSKKEKVKNVKHKPLEIKIEDKTGCLRYVGRIIDNIKIGPSPEWMRKKLESVGLRPINNIVDITNYLLFETGQPMHAFDYDKIEEGMIIVRRAKSEEKIVTIDAEERILDRSILVIADKKRAVAVAGIMGGKDTEVSEATKTVLLESACFEPVVVRKGSKKLALATDSSYRFERGVDLSTVLTASERAAKLIKEFASSLGAEVGGVLKDTGTKVQKERKISLSSEKVSSVLGKKISLSEIKK
ncbi:MAG: phenylalanine--tRNA ligase subunit beta, partial [Candidatus Omnitrophica bacterium]|nr:phenylalanine--tRNA ligase subunit beta [Candidatus Omnitrophota bacterium]